MIELKKQIIEYAQKLNSTNLSPLRSGNVSLRVTNDDVEGFLLTPSGKRYETLLPEDIVFLSLKEKYDNLKLFNSSLNPSSEWRFHQDIYLNKPKAKAIVHAHSPHATAVSTHGKSIPAFHYMVALAGGDDIKCAEYATFGTTELSKNIIEALDKRKACLMSNHGQITFGVNLKQAFELAEEVENICHQYIIALKIGKPKILSYAEMQKILDKIKHYKKA
jgi:L-fuculose-phosphate aldolase|tara:strand:+ start:889 stop:1548 length:660 start_codon:yes stop_codon:yes gene_type:complete